MANQGARHATGAELGQAGGGSPPRAPPNVKPSSFGRRSDPARPAAVARLGPKREAPPWVISRKGHQHRRIASQGWGPETCSW